jgi:essential nuclear protein 1
VNGDGYIDASSSRKILAIAQELADEDDEERKAVAKAITLNPAFAIDSRFANEEDGPEGGKAAAYDDNDDDDEGWMPDEDVAVDDVDPEDMAMYNKFLPKGGEFGDFASSIANLSTTDGRKDSVEDPRIVEEEGESTNLAELILKRIAEKEAATAAQSSGRPVIHGGGPPEDAIEIPANVAEVFEK